MFKFAVLTISTKGSSGTRADESGPLIMRMLAPFGTSDAEILPDDREMIEAALVHYADEYGADAVFTTGGTGLSPDDVTPEATMAVVSRLVPGIPEAMRAKGMEVTSRAMLSRAVAGVRGRTLIVNLPGSPKACAENLEVLLPVLEHALTSLQGKGGDCAR